MLTPCRMSNQEFLKLLSSVKLLLEYRIFKVVSLFVLEIKHFMQKIKNPM